MWLQLALMFYQGVDVWLVSGVDVWIVSLVSVPKEMQERFFQQIHSPIPKWLMMERKLCLKKWNFMFLILYLG